ncbi:hypothetical protein LCGC14_2623980 [marine sediment metagenome]|uniref:Uncharacterized protein n=1 Tax=marine sediment metagenome TaxID=412755 RepID=A0A0F9CUQ4_9ZZZZ
MTNTKFDDELKKLMDSVIKDGGTSISKITKAKIQNDRDFERAVLYMKANSEVYHNARNSNMNESEMEAKATITIAMGLLALEKAREINNGKKQKGQKDATPEDKQKSIGDELNDYLNG